MAADPARDDMTLRGISADRLTDRKSQLRSFDGLRDADSNGSPWGVDTFTEQAFGLLTSYAWRAPLIC
jgi:hypothetical protein